MPGHRGSLEPLARAYAGAGAIVVTITAPFARSDALYRPPALFTLPLFDDRDRLELVQTVKDLRRAVDYLEHSGVAAGQIGFVGHSYGGIAGALLYSIERRIRACAIMTAPPSLAAQFRDPDGEPIGLLAQPTTEEQAAWLEEMDTLAATRFVSFAAPAALLFQIAVNDRGVRQSDAEALAMAATEPKQIMYYDADHELVPEAFRDQAAWFARHLDIELASFRAPDLRRRRRQEVSTVSSAFRSGRGRDAQGNVTDYVHWRMRAGNASSQAAVRP